MTLPSIASIHISTRRPCSCPWRTERGQRLIYSFRSLSGVTCSFSLPHPFSLTGPHIPLSPHGPRKSSRAEKYRRNLTAHSHPSLSSIPPSHLEWSIGKGKTVDQLEAECTCHCLLFLSVYGMDICANILLCSPFATQGSILWSSSFLLPGYPTSTNGHMGSPLHVCHSPLPSRYVLTESPSSVFPCYYLTRKDV